MNSPIDSAELTGNVISRHHNGKREHDSAAEYHKDGVCSDVANDANKLVVLFIVHLTFSFLAEIGRIELPIEHRQCPVLPLNYISVVSFMSRYSSSRVRSGPQARNRERMGSFMFFIKGRCGLILRHRAAKSDSK